jgi:hypothetical protein
VKYAVGRELCMFRQEGPALAMASSNVKRAEVVSPVCNIWSQFTRQALCQLPHYESAIATNCTGHQSCLL